MSPLLLEPQIHSTTTTNHTEDGNDATIPNGCSSLSQPQQQQQPPDQEDPASPQTEPTSALDSSNKKEVSPPHKLKLSTKTNHTGLSQSSHSKTRLAASTKPKRRNSTTGASIQQQKASTSRSKPNNALLKRSTSTRSIRPPPPFSMIVLDPTVRQPGPLGNPASLMDPTIDSPTHKDDNPKPLVSSSAQPMPSAGANTCPPHHPTPSNHHPLTPSARQRRSVVDRHSLNTPVLMSPSLSPRKHHEKPAHPPCGPPTPPFEPTRNNPKMTGMPCASPFPKSPSKQRHSSSIPPQQLSRTNSQRRLVSGEGASLHSRPSPATARVDGSSYQPSPQKSVMSTPQGRRHSTRTSRAPAAAGAAAPPPPPFSSSLTSAVVSPRRSGSDHNQKVIKPKNPWSHDTMIHNDNNDYDDDKYQDISSSSFLSTTTHTTGYYNYPGQDDCHHNHSSFSCGMPPMIRPEQAVPSSPERRHRQRQRRPSLMDRVGTLMCLAHPLSSPHAQPQQRQYE